MIISGQTMEIMNTLETYRQKGWPVAEKTTITDLVNFKIENLQIEKGVSIPVQASAYDQWRQLFERMEVGDSVFMPVTKFICDLMRTASYRHKKTVPGFKLQFMQTPEGFRVWRIA